jgi:hypothetical protein
VLIWLTGSQRGKGIFSSIVPRSNLALKTARR